MMDELGTKLYLFTNNMNMGIIFAISKPRLFPKSALIFDEECKEIEKKQEGLKRFGKQKNWRNLRKILT